jgi:hypothetical protein
MTLTWDISFLLDIQGKIEEARGNCLEILGEPARAMVGRSFLPFITGADRAHFRRFLGQLDNARAVRRALLHLRTSLRGDRPFFMEAQNGWSAARFWILLAVPTDQANASPLAALEAPVPATSDDDLLMLIELTAEQAVPLDLTVFAVGGLASSPAADAPEAMTEADRLRRQVEKNLLASAYDGVVSRTAPGVYNVLHDAQISAEKIAGEVTAGAREAGIGEGQLGLTHRTVKLGSRPDRERIKAAMAAAKAPVQDRSLPPGADADRVAAPARQSPMLYLMLGAIGLLALGLGVAMYLVR